MKHIYLALTIALLFVTACQSNEPTPAPTDTASPPTSAPITVPTATSTPLPTSTPTAQPTAAPTEPPVPTPTPTLVSAEVWVSATDGLNLRSDAKSTATLIKTLPLGTHLIAVGPKSGPDDKGITWQNVKTDDGQSGWASAEFLTTAKPTAAATPTPTPIVSATPSATTPSATTPTPTATVPVTATTSDVWTTDILNLRAQPGKTANVLATIAVNQHLTAIGSKTAPDADGISWQNVKTDDGLVGWVSAQYLTNIKPATSTPSSTTFTNDAAIAAELLRRTNELRAQNGLSAYIVNSDLTRIALAQAQYMASTHQFTHTGPDGTTPRQRIVGAGYGEGRPGENGYMGTFEQAWNFFKTDSSHLANLLDSYNNVVGLGVVTSEGFTYITMDFGKPAVDNSP